jgi:hypothetical protein
MVVNVLTDPAGTMRQVRAGDSIFSLAIVVLSASLLGLATVPKQLRLLLESLPPVEDALLNAQHEALRAGIIRMIMVDRLIPSPTLLLAVVIAGLMADSVLGLPRDRRGRIWTVLALGLAPVLIGRAGELAMTYLLRFDTLSPGIAITLPHRFSTGPLLLWLKSDPAPAWLEIADSRINLITLWVAGLWVVGLREVDDARRVALWHVALPLFCIGVAGVVTWASGPLMFSVILGAG